MLRLRAWLLLLLMFLGVALNIERLDFGQTENVVNLASFVYVLAGGAVITTIMLPSNWKISTRTIVIFWLVVYFSIKLIFSTHHPIIGGLYTYLTIVEIVVVAGLVVITHKVMENLHILEETVANITLSDVSNRVKNFDAAASDISKEFARSRRYKRPLGVVVIRLNPENTKSHYEALSKDILRLVLSRYSLSNLIRALDKEIRRPDLILEQFYQNRIILLLPEANIEAAQAVSRNVQKIAKDKADSSIAVGFAAFPNDAITFEDLIIKAERVIDERENGSAEKLDLVGQDIHMDEETRN